MSIDTKECILWPRTVKHGYAFPVCINRKMFYRHRLAYMVFVGQIPEDLQIDHLCRNRNCINPHHLEAVTRKENILRGVSPSAINSRKTKCANGHLFSKENTYRCVGKKRVERKCRTCSLASLHKFREKERQSKAALEREGK